jgi:hypothetical protein
MASSKVVIGSGFVVVSVDKFDDLRDGYVLFDGINAVNLTYGDLPNNVVIDLALVSRTIKNCLKIDIKWIDFSFDFCDSVINYNGDDYSYNCYHKCNNTKIIITFIDSLIGSIIKIAYISDNIQNVITLCTAQNDRFIGNIK